MSWRERLLELFNKPTQRAPVEMLPEEAVIPTENSKDVIPKQLPQTENQQRILKKLQEADERKRQVAAQQAVESATSWDKQRAFELKAEEEAISFLQKIQEAGLEETVSMIFSSLDETYRTSAKLHLDSLRPISLLPEKGKPLIECLNKKAFEDAVLGAWGAFDGLAYSTSSDVDRARERWLKGAEPDSLRVVELHIALEWDWETETETHWGRSDWGGPLESYETSRTVWKQVTVQIRQDVNGLILQVGDSQPIPENEWSQEILENELIKVVSDAKK